MSSSGLFLVCRGCNGNSRLGGACPSSSFSRQQTAAAATSSGRRGGGETETEKDRSERLLRERERPAKVMARRGIASRRESEKLMQAGHVRINGTIHKDPGQKIPSDSNICIIPGSDTASSTGGGGGLLVKPSVLLHKPVGIVSTQPDPKLKQVPAWKLLTEKNISMEKSSYHSSDTNFDVDDGDSQRKERNENEKEIILQSILSKPWQMNVVGRLDKNSRGLLLMTQDGVLARKVIGTKNVTKHYLVRCSETVDARQLKKLNAAMTLDGVRLLPMKVKLSVNDPQVLEFELREGRKHQIRRCCSKVGLRVTDLLRTSIGPFSLGNLEEGQWRLLTREEKKKLK